MGRVGRKQKSRTRNVSQKLNASKAQRERRARMSEAERNVQLEKARLSKQIYRVLMSAEKREEQLKQQREFTRQRRIAEKVKPMKEEVSIIEWQLEKIRNEEGRGADDAEVADLELQKTVLENRIRQLLETPVRPIKRTKSNGVGPPLQLEEMAASSTATAGNPFGVKIKTEPEDSDDDDSSDDADSLPGPSSSSKKVDDDLGPEEENPRLAALQAKRVLLNLRSYPANETPGQKAKRLAEMKEQKTKILKLMKRYPDEFNVRKPQSEQSKKEATEKNYIRFNRPADETKAERFARITKFLEEKANGADLTSQSAEELATKIIEEIEACRQQSKALKQLDSLPLPQRDKASERRRKKTEYGIERRVINRYTAPPDLEAERKAKAAAAARDRNKFEKAEYHLFKKLLNSEDPLKALLNDESAPSVLEFWKNYKNMKKNLPDNLKEYRDQIYSILNEAPENESEDERNLRFGRQNEELKSFFAKSGEELDKFLTKRKEYLNDYIKQAPIRQQMSGKIITEEEKDSKRRRFNAKLREYYLKTKLKQGIVIQPKGERPHANKYYDKANKSSISRKPSMPRKSGVRRPRKSRDLSPTSSMEEGSELSSEYRQNWRNSSSAAGNNNNNSNRWPSLGLAADNYAGHAASSESGSQYQDDGNDDDDEWLPLPVPHFEGHPPPVNQSQNPFHHPHHSVPYGAAFVGFNHPSVHHQTHPNNNAVGLDEDLFHRLIQTMPAQANNYSSSNPNPGVHQMAMYQQQQPAGSSIQNLHFQQHQQQQLQQLQQQHHHQTQPVWNPNIPQANSPLNYSVQFLPNSQIAVATEAPSSSKRTAHHHPSSQNNAQIPDAELVLEVATTNDDIFNATVRKVKRPRRRRGPDGELIGPAVPSTPKPKVVGPPINSVPVPPPTPVVIELQSNVDLNPKLKCSHCDKVFRTEIACSQHKRKSHALTEQFTCKVCKKVWRNEGDLTAHIWKFHVKRKLNKCPVCPMEYLNRRHLVEHFRMHPEESNSFLMGISSMRIRKTTPINKFWCGLCPSYFDTFIKLMEHRQELHKCICRVCGIILNDLEHLAEHFLRRHPEVEWEISMDEDWCKLSSEVNSTTAKEFSCETCHSRFSTKEFLAEHKAEGHPKRERSKESKNVCKICDLCLDGKQSQAQHATTCWLQHFKCFWCEEDFSSEELRWKHLRAKHSQEKTLPKQMKGGSKTFKCELCRRSFDSILVLRAHFDSKHIAIVSKPLDMDSIASLNHSKEKHGTGQLKSSKCICSFCGIFLKNSDSLVDHTVRCHPEIDLLSADIQKDLYYPAKDHEEVFNCEDCDSPFASIRFLAEHEYEGHPKRTKLGDKRKHQCESCDMRFQSITDRDEHLGSCSLRNFKCYFCTQVYNSKYLRLQHISEAHPEQKSVPSQILDGYRNFKCELCRRSYDSSSQVRIHIESDHKDLKPLSNKMEVTLKRIIFELKSKANKLNSSAGPNSMTLKVKPIAEQEKAKTPSKSAAEINQEETPTGSTTEASIIVYPCPICPSKYKTKEFIEQHIATSHPDSSKHYKVYCDICHKGLSDKMILIRHKKAFHNPKRKLHQCPHCPTQLTRAEHLRNHILKIHENPNPIIRKKKVETPDSEKFPCDLCKAVLSSQKGLAQHKANVHIIVNVLIFCEICGKQMRDYADKPGGLKHHMKKIHPDHDQDQIISDISAYTLPRIPLPQIMQLIDELTTGRRNKPRKSRAKKPRTEIKEKPTPRRSSSTKNKKQSKEFEESDPDFSEEEEAESDYSSNDEEGGDLFSSGDESSFEDNDDSSENEEDGEMQKEKKNSLKFFVIKPEKRKSKSKRLTRSKAKGQRSSNNSKQALIETVSKPSIILQRCDEEEEEDSSNDDNDIDNDDHHDVIYIDDDSD